MGTLNPNIPSAELNRALTDAATDMASFGLRYLTPQLLLHTFLHDEKLAANQLLRKLAEQRGFKWDDLARRVEQMARNAPGRDANFPFTDNFGQDVPLAEEMLVVIDEGLTIAQTRDGIQVGTAHALAAMADQRVTTYGVLQRMGISQAGIIALLDEVDHDGMLIVHDYMREARAGDATPLYQRKALLQAMQGILALAGQRHIVLVGPEGSGKRSLVYSLAQLLAEGNGRSDIGAVVQINETALLENPLGALRVGLRRASGGILLVPAIGRFFPIRSGAQLPQQVQNDLQKAILQTEHVIIGTATSAEYDLISQFDVARSHLHRIDVPPATRDEAVTMLSFHQTRLEQEYDIAVAPDALAVAARIAGQYIQSPVLPASAVQLANRAAALERLAVQGHVLEHAFAGDGTLTADEMLLAASEMTKVPVSRLNPDEQSKYANMVERLHERIIGQDEAVLAVSRAVKVARVGLRDPKRPIGSFLFVGPSGVGKTELAKALAEFMFGSEDAMIVLDMSEYQEEASVNRLIGAPPGYVGFEGGGQLTDFVRERPYTVVLLDEIEKANERVMDVLLQVLEEGRLTDGQGRTTMFSETVVIMTSNLGAEYLLTAAIGERERSLVMDKVHRFLRPEFINRLDDIIFFLQLTPEELAQILDLMLRKEFKLAKQQGIDLAITPTAKQWLLAQNDQPQFGARPLRRIIGRYLREPLADFLLSQTTRPENTVIIVDADENGLQFKT
ncbi:MAG: ATP-dependent Clp protease ATP-binding subunit [Anaerolineae bacterium]|nr:ATP-dependent Clp protease ATP-binding subunit [Anaerolineae bacterium]